MVCSWCAPAAQPWRLATRSPWVCFRQKNDPKGEKHGHVTLFTWRNKSIFFLLLARRTSSPSSYEQMIIFPVLLGLQSTYLKGWAEVLLVCLVATLLLQNVS